MNTIVYLSKSQADALMARSELTELKKYVTAEHGRLRRLANDLGVTYQYVQKWIKAGLVPADRVADVERLTGIPRHILNPYPFIKEEEAA